MGSSFKGFLRGTYRCQLQFVRYRNKINITHPRPPHFERALVENVCLPKFENLPKIPQYIPLYENCEARTPKKRREPYPIEVILAKEIRDWLTKSQFISIFHKNFMDEEQKFEHLVILKKNGVKILDFDNVLVERSIKGTAYEPILRFYQSHTCIGVSETLNLHNFMSILKQLPLLTLMAAIVNNRLLDYSQLQKYGELKNIEEARMKLVGLLTLAPQNLVNQLNHHQTSLIQSLEQIKELKNNEK